MFEIAPSNAKHITQNRFEWTDKIVMGQFMPFAVVPKTTVTKHFVFETRWEDPVIQAHVDCALEMRSDSGPWLEVTAWHLTLFAAVWSELVDNGASMSFHPNESERVQDACVPADLHRYTGTKDPIPTTGLGPHRSFLDYPQGEVDDSAAEDP
jgi:hypothetical protein